MLLQMQRPFLIHCKNSRGITIHKLLHLKPDTTLTVLGRLFSGSYDFHFKMDALFLSVKILPVDCKLLFSFKKIHTVIPGHSFTVAVLLS